MCPGHAVMETAFDLGGLSPAKTKQSKQAKKKSHHEEKIRQILTDGNSTECLTSTPQNRQGHGKHRNSEKLSQPRGT